MMLIPRAITSINRRCVASVKSTPLSFDIKRSTSTSSENEEAEKFKKKLKQWREMPNVERTLLSMMNRPKKRKLVLPRDRLKFLRQDFTEWFEKSKLLYLRGNQRFIAERHGILGCNLATAHFLIYRDGRVKFHNQTDWVVKQNDQRIPLPDKYDPTWELSHIDASGIHLYYDGINNFQNLNQVIWADFSKNPHLDDWCIDKLSGNLPGLEYLNISECEKVTENSLEALYRLPLLKTLIITDWHKKPSFELCCTMLEDCMPYLTIEVKAPEEKIPVEEKNEDMSLF